MKNAKILNDISNTRKRPRRIITRNLSANIQKRKEKGNKQNKENIKCNKTSFRMNLRSKKQPKNDFDPERQKTLKDPKTNKTIINDLITPKKPLKTTKISYKTQKIPLCDKKDKNNELFSTHCAEEIFSLMRISESEKMPSSDYMEKIQNDITGKMRSVLIDWMLRVQHKFQMGEETAFLAVNYLDRFLSLKSITRGKLQLLGAVSLFLASKIEEVSPPLLKNLVYVCDGACTREDMEVMETKMLETLDWRLHLATSMFFCRRFLRIAGYLPDDETFPSKKTKEPQNSLKKKKIKSNVNLFTKYLLELSLIDYSFVKFPPSLKAASATYFALKTFSAPFDSKEFFVFAHYRFGDMKLCLEEFSRLFESESFKENKTFVSMKYSKWLHFASLKDKDFKFKN